MSEINLVCGTCHPGVVPKTAAAQRNAARYKWCNTCGCGRPFYPATSIVAKKDKKDDGKRDCRWPGCPKRVDPSMWGCKPHWFALPAHFRNAILAAYQPGQEDDLRLVKREWVEADRAARDWITAHAK